jgi:release factor glutamine methyltransferase
MADCVIRHLLSQSIIALRAAGIKNPALDAEAMLAAASHSTRAAVLAGLAIVDDSVHQRYAMMVSRRVRREPLAYIFGIKEFYSLDFKVTPAVLIPRPETETVVTTALNLISTRRDFGGALASTLPRRNAWPRVLDIGTGSGALALAIAINWPAAEVTATDVSSEALAVARRNASRLKVSERVRFRQADCFESMDGLGSLGRYDLIVSNPPYVKDDEIERLAPEINRYEPRIALAGGREGLDFYHRIAPLLKMHLEEGGAVIFELGAEQSRPVADILCAAGAGKVDVIADLAGLPRVAVGHFS